MTAANNTEERVCPECGTGMTMIPDPFSLSFALPFGLYVDVQLWGCREAAFCAWCASGAEEYSAEADYIATSAYDEGREAGYREAEYDYREPHY